MPLWLSQLSRLEMPLWLSQLSRPEISLAVAAERTWKWRAGYVRNPL